jgi:multicomponent Na+:H+ antiporter subunit D
VISQNLPALQVVVPLMSAPLCTLLRRGSLAWVLAVAISATALTTAVTLLFRVLAGGVIRYSLGGWPAPYGIEYRIDTVNAFVLVIVATISTVALIFAKRSVEDEIVRDKQHLFYAAWMLFLTGLLGIAITGDAFNVFVFLEISSLSTYLLVSFGRDRRALMASYRYLILGTIGATFLLIGIGLLYMMTGTLNMVDIAERLPAAIDTRTAKVAFAFVLVGLGIKAAVFPLHVWLPNAYTYAPSAVSVVVAATGTKVAVYLIMRFIFSIFGSHFVFDTLGINVLLLVLALLGMFVASTIAIFQINIKRMLAWSSIAQIGYMMLGIAMVSQTALTASIVHLFNHAIMKAALFMVMGAVFLRVGSVRIEKMAGLGREMPWTMAAFVVAGLSLVGVPLTVGFVSKWYLVLAALEGGRIWIAVLVLLSSLLALVYTWRVVEVAYFRERSSGQPVREAPLIMLVPMWLLVAASIYFGVNSELTVDVASRAAMTLRGGPL